MTNIKISENKTGEGWEFEVTIEEQGSETTHTVKMSQDFYDSLNTKTSPEEVVHKSFSFLLKREPKEQILSKFDITLISHSFPDFSDYIQKIWAPN